MDNRPQGRDKKVSGQGSPVFKRGSGLGTGPVGSQDGYQGRKSSNSGPGFSSKPVESGRQQRSSGSRSGGGGGLLKLIVLMIIFLGGGGSLSGLLNGGSDPVSTTTRPSAYTTTKSASSGAMGSLFDSLFSGSAYSGSQSGSNLNQGFSYSAIMGNHTGSSSGTGTSQNGTLNTSVASGSREKYTKLKGNGQDTVTILVYMCGTDLESGSGMATKDIQEMVNASIGDKVNLILYTGGCKQWKNNVISSRVNQIYQIKNGKLYCLNDNAGSASMTDSDTLASFIQYGKKNFPADRSMLIMWDHGGGSLSGYGYDEKTRSASMTLTKLQAALKQGGMKFDLIGFDACLMATLENGLMLDAYADYMLASEETEPGIGWYYTDWLTALSRNTSLSTPELSKQIIDDFVAHCSRQCPGQKTTLSLVDLAELSSVVSEKFCSFSAATLELLNHNGYKTVSDARVNTREFSTSKIDQIDLVHLAKNLNTRESLALADAVLSAVKYNRTSSNMTNAYGLSLYFPYQKMNKVDSAVATYNALGLDEEYAECIRTFASLEVSGQAAAGGSSSPAAALNGTYSGSMIGGDALAQALAQMLSGGMGSSLTGGNFGFLGRSLDPEAAAAYIKENRIVDTDIIWREKSGRKVLSLSESQWSLVQALELNVFVDDGEGYIDLGLDNSFLFTREGDLIGEYDGSWLAIDRHPVAYYHMDSAVEGNHYSITGRVPVLLNGERAELILVFTSEQPEGYVAGARRVYGSGETETVAKSLTELKAGDVIDYLCDYYLYDGTYADSYFLGDAVTWRGDETIRNVKIGEAAIACYRLTDIYNNHFWTPVME